MDDKLAGRELDAEMFGSATATAANTFSGSLTMDTLRESMKQMEEMMSSLRGGIHFPPAPRILEYRWLTKRIQVRFSRRHKKRVLKKLARDPRNFREVPQTSVYIIDGAVIAHPTMAAKIRAALKATGEGR